MKILHRLEIWREHRLALSDLFRSMVKGAGTAFIIQSSGMVLKYVSVVLLARWISSSREFDAYVFSFISIQLLAVAAALGLTTSSLRFIPEYITGRKWGELKGWLRRSRQLVVLAGVAIALVGSVILFVVDGRSSQGTAFLIGLWLVPIYALSEVQMQSIRATHRVATAFAPSFLMQPILLITGAGVLFVWWGQLTAVMALSCLGAALVAVVLIQRILLLATLPEPSRGVPPVDETRRWLEVSFPLLLSAGFLIVMNRTDNFLLGLWGDEGETGIYFVASRTAQQAAFMLAAVNAIVAPMVSTRHARGDREGLQRVCRFAVQLVFWPSLVVAVFLLVFSEWVLRLSGPEFVEGQTALFVLVIGQLFNALTGPVGVLLALSGRQKLSTRVYGCCAALNILLNVLFIPAFGMTGAAFATATSLIIANLWLAILVVRQMGIMPVPWLPLPSRFVQQVEKK
jgi:O-antigen/teichoic acid export membrane protein